MGKQETTIVKYTCDNCGTEIVNYYGQTIEIIRPLKGDGCQRLRVTVTHQVDYVYCHQDSVLCDKCEIAMLKAAIAKLEYRNKVKEC